jgi:micrococcal nuclease
LEGLETEARKNKKGMWADPQPVPPWQWRCLHREDHQGAPVPTEG